ncbi:MAG: hypothetical protein INH41_26405 [Myxococcaceae bacterium]|nr:hypothetical protein [Myxococcaceae bacterium]MCA3015932.1 hypothetical protein [Myxococcaceae bacterium]
MERLWWPAAVEGLLVQAVAPPMTPALRQRVREAGIDVAPLDPASLADMVRRAIDLVAREL